MNGEISCKKILTGTRYLIVVPVLGLALASVFFFVFGGFGLFRVLFELLVEIFGFWTGHVEEIESALVVIEVVEYVHTFLVGTVLFITAVGLYQLFINEIQFPGWLKVDSTEELETSLIGVTVVVLAVNFMSEVFIGHNESLLDFGAGIALPIAALGVFVGLRAWATKLTKEVTIEEKHEEHSAGADSGAPTA